MNPTLATSLAANSLGSGASAMPDAQTSLPISISDCSIAFCACLSVQTTAGGLILSTTGGKALQDALVGEVLAVGESVEAAISKGDKVLYSKYSSTDVSVADGEVCFVAEKSILAKLS
jgi:co-chaperonin GroES (HSP10)